MTSGREGRAERRAAAAAPANAGGRVFEAAKRVLAERGLNAGVGEVIARAGGAGSLYRYFASKEELFRAVAGEMVERTRTRFVEIASQERDARTCIALTMELGFQNLQRYGQLAIELFSGAHPPEYEGLFNRRALEAYFAALIERGIRQGHFPADLDIDYAVGAWFALVAPSVLRRLLESRSVEEIARSTARFFLAGVSGTACEQVTAK